MRIILICLLTIIIQNNTFGKCGLGVEYYPFNDLLKSESLIVLFGYGLENQIDYDVIQNLDKEYPIYLVSDGYLVELEVLKINIGDLKIIQAILKPKEKLIPGNLYKLIIYNTERDSSFLFKRYNERTQRNEDAQWSVAESNDSLEPKILSKPMIINNYSVIYGCGPEVLVKFQLKTNKNNVMLVEAELKDRNDNNKKFILRLDDDKIVEIGRNMCFGGFELKYQTGYKVRFKLIDDNGNKSKDWSQWVTFTRPDDPYKK